MFAQSANYPIITEKVFVRFGDKVFRTRSISYIERVTDANGTVYQYNIHYDQGIISIADDEPGFNDIQSLFMFSGVGLL